MSAPAAPPERPSPWPVRFWHVLWSPESALREAAEFPKQTWWPPLVWALVVGVAGVAVLLEPVLTPYTLDAMRRQGAAAEDLALVQRIMPVIAYGGMGVTVVLVVGVAAVAHLGARLLGGQGKWLATLAAVTQSQVVNGLEALVRVPMQLATRSMEVRLGPAALAPEGWVDTPAVKLLTAFDVFSLWKVGLVALGLAVAHRLPRRRAFAATFSIWLVIAVGLAWLSP